jgi:hypothetical protein
MVLVSGMDSLRTVGKRGAESGVRVGRIRWIWCIARLVFLMVR